MREKMKNFLYILILLITIFINNYTLANYDITKDTKIEKKQINYENYVSYYFEGEKCSGYDFEPDKVEVIDLTGIKLHLIPKEIKIEDPKIVSKLKKLNNAKEIIGSYVELDNSKTFWINNSTEDCPSIILKGKDGYKQLPNGCCFTIGVYCVDPNNEEAEGKSFIYEFTNKGIEHLSNTTMMEYDNVGEE